MKAAYINAPCPPEFIQLGDLPTPEPKAGEVRVRIASASVNPIDTYIRSGMVAMNLPKPFIPGCDFAGTVDAIGTGVTRFKPGDRVWGSNQGLLGRQGTFAEYCCPAEEFVYSLPESVSFQDAAAVALVGITAHLGLFACAKLRPGEWVFVNGGTGGVGAMVVQMAKAAGAKVVTTVGSDEKKEIAYSLGADHVFNYKTSNPFVEIRGGTEGHRVNVWFETQPPTDLELTIECMAPRGRIIVMAGRNARPVFPNGPFYVKGLSLHGFAMFNATAAEQRVCAEEINRWFTDGKLKPLIGRVFPLAESAAAHALQESNTLGKSGTLTGKILIDVTTA
jgi:NADPH2:quinone reductase